MSTIELGDEDSYLLDLNGVCTLCPHRSLSIPTPPRPVRGAHDRSCPMPPR